MQVKFLNKTTPHFLKLIIININLNTSRKFRLDNWIWEVTSCIPLYMPRKHNLCVAFGKLVLMAFLIVLSPLMTTTLGMLQLIASLNASNATYMLLQSHLQEV